MTKKVITVFGNEVDVRDNLAVSLVPELQTRMPNIEFKIEDPTESLEPPSDPWIILDVGIGIEEVTMVTDLSQLEQVKGSSVHDFDVYMELRLKEKLGLLPQINIILLPHDMAVKQALIEIEKVIEKLQDPCLPAGRPDLA